MQVRVRLLDGFDVEVDGEPVDAEAWQRRKSAELVQLLALAPGARLHRERVVDALWPGLDLPQALPRLHKAAHFARRALGAAPGALELRQELVGLAVGHELHVDVRDFEASAREVLDRRPCDPRACGALVRDRPAALLPDVAGDWVEEHRARQRALVAELLRAAGMWPQLLRLDPLDEEGYVGQMRAALERGDRSAGLRAYDTLAGVLAEELRVEPGPRATRLRDALAALDDRAGSVEEGWRDEPRPGLVERAHELDAMMARTSAALEAGRGSLVLVSGDPGVGKSALVEAFVAQVPADVRVLRGACDDLVAPRSLGPFQDMALGDQELLAVLTDGSMPGLLPELLAGLSRSSTVAVVEDLHWADDATLDAMRFLARRIVTSPVVLVATFRAGDLGPEHPLTSMLGVMAGDHVLRLDLEPLSVAAVGELGGFGEQEAAEVHRVTGGNPFFVTEVIAAGAGEVPATVRDAVLARIARLEPRTRTLLRTLSVVPGRVERRVADTLADELAAGVDALVGAERSGVLVGDSGGVSFRHELARRAVETSLTATERMAAHRAVLDVLLSTPGVARARLVHHAAFGGRRDELLALGPEAAAEAARQGAHRQCVEILRLLLDGPEPVPAELAPALWSARSYSSYVVNRFEAAYSSAERAVELADERGDELVLGEAVPVLARAAMFARGPEAARQAAERAVQVARAEGDAAGLAAALTELARAHSNLPSVSVVADHSSVSQRAADEALAIASGLERPDLVARSLCYRGEARVSLHDDRGFDDLERAIDLAGSDPRPETRVRCLVNAAGSAFRAGRLPDVERYVGTGLALAEDCEFFAGEYRLRLTRAAARAASGAWDDAVDELDDLLRSPGEPGIMEPLARTILARLLARRGAPEAETILAAARADPRRTASPFVTGVLAVAAAEIGWLDGSLAELRPDTARSLRDLAAAGFHGVAAELTAYLRRAQVPAPDPPGAPGPWAPTLAGHHREAADAWLRLGERYESAVVLASSSDPDERREGSAALAGLGAVAVLPALG